jgi:hypothetical protein
LGFAPAEADQIVITAHYSSVLSDESCSFGFFCFESLANFSENSSSYELSEEAIVSVNN